MTFDRIWPVMRGGTGPNSGRGRLCLVAAIASDPPRNGVRCLTFVGTDMAEMGRRLTESPDIKRGDYAGATLWVQCWPDGMVVLFPGPAEKTWTQCRPDGEYVFSGGAMIDAAFKACWPDRSPDWKTMDVAADGRQDSYGHQNAG